ncbi:unnamed protein product [Camellia sinensis]
MYPKINRITAKELFEKNHKNLRDNAEEAFKHMNNGLMLVTTLIGNVNYAALFTLPGGYDQENTSKTYGQSVLLIQKDTHDDIVKFLCSFRSGSSSGVGDAKIWCIEKEGQALLILKQGLVDEEKADCCRWSAVYYSNETGHVTKLDLGGLPIPEASAIPLRGDINSSLVELQHLNYLDLSNNNFGGSRIPEFIGSLSNIQHLDLSYAKFGGTVPSQLGNLSKLQSLDLSTYGGGSMNVKTLSGFPVFCSVCWFFLISAVVCLLINMSMTTIKERSSQQFVDVFVVVFLQFVNSPPASSSGVKDAKIWCIEKERQTLLILKQGFVDDYGRLSSWGSEKEKADCCRWRGVHCSNRTGHVTMLGLGSLPIAIPLRGNISPSLVELQHLNYLDLSNNNFGGSRIPEFIGSLSNLRHLNLSYAGFGGTVPSQLGNLSKLQSLDLSPYGGMNVQNLEWLSHLSSLRHLNLQNVDLSNNRLQVLDVNSNHLEGLVFAAHLSNLSRLQFLDLSLNSLVLKFNSGWIPPFHLDTIRLRSCKLGPHFPKWLQTQKNVSVLDISAAGISATIPSWFWDLSPRMRLLNISYNQINGIMPDLSLKFPAFPAIDLSSNHFAGPIPFLPRGELPDCWMQFTYLDVLNLANNNLTGKIPRSLGSISKLKRFDPTIYVIYDQTYTIRDGEEGYYSPHYVLSALLVWKGREYEYKNTLGLVKSIDLSSNKLTGEIPSNITRLVGLVAMNFSRNRITGPMPAEIGDLKLLESLDLKNPIKHSTAELR